MNLKIEKNDPYLILHWDPIPEEEFYLISFHVVQNAEPFAMIVYPDMIKNNSVVIPQPPFPRGYLRFASFSEQNPDIYGDPIREEKIWYN